MQMLNASMLAFRDEQGDKKAKRSPYIVGLYDVNWTHEQLVICEEELTRVPGVSQPDGAHFEATVRQTVFWVTASRHCQRIGGIVRSLLSIHRSIVYSV
jgi:hypothetical protein